MTDESDETDITTEWFGDSPDEPDASPLAEGIHYDVSDRRYHGDPAERMSLSSSMAFILATQSAKHAQLYHPRMGGARREETDATENGSISHALILGAGRELEVVRIEEKVKGKPTGLIIDAKDWRTDAAKEARKAIRAAGRIPVLRQKHDIIKGTVAAVRESIAELDEPVILDGRSEVTLVWTEDAQLDGALVPVLCRARIDHLRLSAGVWYDFKFCDSVSPRSVQRHMVEYGTDIQHWAYTSALSRLVPTLAGRWDGQIVFCESKPPYCVTPVRPDGAMREMGEHRWERAKTMWARALRDGRWPGYTSRVLDIAPPAYAMAEEMDKT